MNKIDITNIYTKIKISRRYDATDDLYVRDINGKVFIKGKRNSIGKFSCKVLYLEEYPNSVESLYWDLDSITQQYTEFADILIKLDNELEDTELSYLTCSDVVMLEDIELDEEYKGKGIGSVVYNDIIKLNREKLQIPFVVLKPFPIQHSGNMGEVEYELNFEKDKAKVIQFWERQGFHQIQDTDFYLHYDG